MANTKCIIFALTAFGKSAEAIIFPVRYKIIAASRKYFMPVGLVANIPYQLIVRSVINIMERSGQFYNAEAGAKMAPMHTYYINDVLPQLVAELVELFTGQFFKVSR